MVSLGRNASTGLLEFRWERDAPLSVAVESDITGSASVGATIFTGSGEQGIPLGLLVGETELPTNAGVHRIAFDLPTPGGGEVKMRVVREEVLP